MAEKRLLADALRRDENLLAQTKADAAAKLRTIPIMAKGVKANQRPSFLKIASLAAVTLGLLGWLWGKRPHQPG